MCGTVRAFIQLLPDWCTLALWILEDKRLHLLLDLWLPDDDCYRVRTPEFWSLRISYTAHILYSRTVLRNAICSIPGGKFLILSDGGRQGELVSILVETNINSENEGEMSPGNWWKAGCLASGNELGLSLLMASWALSMGFWGTFLILRSFHLTWKQMYT